MGNNLARDIRDILDVVADRGYEIRRGSKHWKVMSPQGGVLASVSTTPSDPRTIDNTVALLKRVGVFEYDPRREGQVATPRKTRALNARETAVRAKAKEAMDGVGKMAFARHVVDVASRQSDVRKFDSRDPKKAEKAAAWHIQQLTLHESPIAGWALTHIESAADDVLSLPLPQKEDEVEMATSVIEPPLVEVEKAPRERMGGGRFVRKNDLITDELRGQVRDLAMAIQDGLNIKIRSKRFWGHGTWALMGKLAVEAVERREKVRVFERSGTTDPLETYQKFGARLRTMVENSPKEPWAQTVRAARWLVEDWEAGYRIREDMLLEGNPRSPKGPIPDHLLATVGPLPKPEPEPQEPEDTDGSGSSLENWASRTFEEMDIADPLPMRVSEAIDNWMQEAIAEHERELPLHLRLLEVANRYRSTDEVEDTGEAFNDLLSISHEVMRLEIEVKK